MTRIGQGPTTLVRAAMIRAAWSSQARLAVLAAAGAAVAAWWMWGFTVDDAFIAIRYARHLASGDGYRFNVGLAPTDGVTPLPWAPLLAIVARCDAMTALMHAKYIGLFSWLLAAAAWGAAASRATAHAAHKGVALLLLVLAIPVAAHAVSGMETGVAMALATLAATCPSKPRLAACLAGLAVSFRPEMAPWAIAIAAGFGWAAPSVPLVPTTPSMPPATSRAGRTLACAAIALAPFAACVAVRLVCFGSAAPLAVFAKPSDLAHGLSYAGAAALATLAPIVALGPLAMMRAPRPARVLALAGVVHFAVIIAVGGDWMPYARLAAPITPSLLYAYVLAAPAMHRAASSARAALAVALGVYLVVVAAPAGRHVLEDRAALIAAARPILAPATSIATLDIGWPTAATEATIVDLAGLTDPAIATLPGGHTSKHVDPTFLLDRAPVILVFRVLEEVPLTAWRDASYAYAVEGRLAASDLIADRYAPIAFLTLGAKGGYVVLKRE